MIPLAAAWFSEYFMWALCLLGLAAFLVVALAQLYLSIRAAWKYSVCAMRKRIEKEDAEEPTPRDYQMYPPRHPGLWERTDCKTGETETFLVSEVEYNGTPLGRCPPESTGSRVNPSAMAMRDPYASFKTGE